LPGEHTDRDNLRDPQTQKDTGIDRAESAPGILEA